MTLEARPSQSTEGIGLEKPRFRQRGPSVSLEKRLLIKAARAGGHFQLLSDKEKTILNRRFPAEGRPSTQKEIGEDLGIPRRDIIKIEKRSIRKLKKLPRQSGAKRNKSIRALLKQKSVEEASRYLGVKKKIIYEERHKLFGIKRGYKKSQGMASLGR